MIWISAGMFTLIVVAALVIDLGAMRSVRRDSRLVADAAVTAGAADLAVGTGVEACETALAYAEINVGVDFAGIDCSGFPISCHDATAAVSTTDSNGEWTLTITHPVDDTSVLMDPAAIGATTQTLSAGDGDRCERIGVSLANTYQYTFGQILGNDSTTEVHAVARGTIPSNADVALNLVILERYDCGAINASGSGGGDGGIVTDAVLNTDTGQLDPGYIAVDSDGSSGCSMDGVIDVDGAESFIRADGPAGCTGELGTHTNDLGLTVGEGCGSIQLFADGPPGCNLPACDAGSGTVAPDPVQMSQRITRAPIDHRYNCKASYAMPLGWEIEGCTDPADPNIDQLVAAYGSGVPAGFQVWEPPGAPCRIDASDTLVVTGNVYVDCPGGLAVAGTVMFAPDASGNADVIFPGPVDVSTADGVLGVNTDGISPATSGSGNAVIYFRNGDLGKTAQASIYFHRSTVYFSETTSLTLRGGASSSALVWTAPEDGDFDDLALWSESAADHSFAGHNNLNLTGVFFAPWATIDYTGQGEQEQVAAQFISRKLEVSGTGRLVVRPNFQQAVLFPDLVTVELIR